MFIRLALRSLGSRKGSVTLTILAMTVSVFVLLSVEHIRHQTKQSFANTVSGVDLIVGARTGSLNLLLYSVFRIGAPTNNVSWQAYENIASNPQVSWAVPMSLGDSHRGYRVLGTTTEYFERFSYGQKRKLAFGEGYAFAKTLDVVLGSEVAKQLDYSLGSEIILSHGLTDTSFSRHDKFIFTVVGILKATGTPVDQTVHVSLDGIEAVHLKLPRHITPTPEQIEKLKLQPKNVTAIMLGLKSRMATFAVQRAINTEKSEPLLAILPGVALSELWQMMAILESTLLLVSIFVFVAALLGLSAMLLSSIRSRYEEIRLLRAIGAHPSFLFFLIELEALLISLVSLLFGAGLLMASLLLASDSITANFGLHISYNIFSKSAALFSIAMLVASLLVAAIPSIHAYLKAKRA